ncbi:MAG: PKHD-type hydroxylase [Gammaproteobacteria bacterium]|jgi:PKHD-type hydroxylase
MNVIGQVLLPDELKQVLEIVQSGTFVDGSSTAGARATRVKNNLQMQQTPEQQSQLDKLLLTAMTRSSNFRRIALPRRLRSMVISRYQPGMRYGMHTDNAMMDPKSPFRTDLSLTLFLSEPDTYDGGELVVRVGSSEAAIKLPAGSAVVYPASNLHRVAEVTRGERLAAVSWIQSYVRGDLERGILSDVEQLKAVVTEHAPESDEIDLALRAYSNLLRLWADV